MEEYGIKKNVLTKDKFTEMFLILIIVAAIGTVGNLVGYSVPIMESVPGILIIFAVSFAGLMLTYVIPIKVSYVLYITILGMFLGSKWCPVSAVINEYVGKINMLALSTICLAFCGVGMAKDWVEFKKIGIKGILVALFAMFGTFVGSAIVAQIILKFQNLI